VGFLDELITYERPPKGEEREIKREIELLVRSGLTREQAERLVRKHFARDRAVFVAEEREEARFLEFAESFLRVFLRALLRALWHQYKLKRPERVSVSSA